MRLENLLGPNHYGFVRGKIDSPSTVWYYAETTANYSVSYTHLTLPTKA